MKTKLFSLSGAGVAIATLAVAFGIVIAGGSEGAWTRWSGPNGDFTADATGLAKEWPEDGPPQLWSRELGDGYSGILVDSGRLYTMYRTDDQEVVIAMDAATGKSIWEHAYDASPGEGHVHQFGDGPRATPLISGNRIYTVGISGVMHCLNKKNGKVAWSKELWGEFGGNFLNHGYSSSPMEYEDNIIVLVGGEEQSIVAFDKKTGDVQWKSLSFKNSYSTPQILEVDGENQLVTFMAEEVIGVDPDTGKLKWRYAHQNQWGQNINMPAMVDENLIFFSSPEAGARGLKLTNNGDATEIEEVWSTRKIQFYHVTTVRQGDFVYGTTGTMAPAFMAALNMRTGEIAWRKRGFPKSNILEADGRLIILDEEGVLYLATASPDDLTVHSKVQVLSRVAWTSPTLVGTTLYLRDKEKIVALNLAG